jgi:hypothetical protein
MAVNAPISGRFRLEFARGSFGSFVALCSLSLAAAAILPLSFKPHRPTNVPGASGQHQIASWRHIEDFHQRLAQFKSVFWEPRDSESLRQLIRETSLVHEKTLLEIGTGTGLIALCCLQSGAKSVLATDVNPAALANARWNAELLELSDRLETRLVPLENQGAYSVLRKGERFDLIISNPPWENDTPHEIDEFALYDPGFQLLDSILRGAKDRLNVGGRLLLVYGSVDAVAQLKEKAQHFGLDCVIHDDRNLNILPKVFLPGMLIEVTQQSDGQGPTSQTRFQSR